MKNTKTTGAAAVTMVVVDGREFALCSNADRAEVQASLIASANGPAGDTFAAAVRAGDTIAMRAAWRRIGA